MDYVVKYVVIFLLCNMYTNIGKVGQITETIIWSIIIIMNIKSLCSFMKTKTDNSDVWPSKNDR